MELLGLWSIVLGMMVYASLLLPTAPMAATIFIGVTSLCASIGFVYHGGYYLCGCSGWHRCIAHHGLLAFGAGRKYCSRSPTASSRKSPKP